MMQATFASDGVSRNVLARIAADGPGLGPKALNVKSARTSCPSAPSKGQMRTMTGNLSMRGTMTGSKAKIKAGQLLQLIDGVFEERPGVRIANEKPSILNIDVLVENGVGRGVHFGDKSVLVECYRGQPHRIERGDRR